MPIATLIAAAVSPHHGRRRALFSARATITPGATNGASITNTGRGSPAGPSHQVPMPSSRLAFQTPLHATKTSIHVAAVASRQPTVSWPGRGWRAAGGAGGAGVV